jgi:hypothetical protein
MTATSPHYSVVSARSRWPCSSTFVTGHVDALANLSFGQVFAVAVAGDELVQNLLAGFARAQLRADHRAHISSQSRR